MDNASLKQKFKWIFFLNLPRSRILIKRHVHVSPVCKNISHASHIYRGFLILVNLIGQNLRLVLLKHTKNAQDIAIPPRCNINYHRLVERCHVCDDINELPDWL